jgi:hypothetical protein
MINIKKIKTAKLKNPILIEGLPGIGNVGKLAIDYLVEELKPTLICEIYSDALPHNVFITDDDTIEPMRLSVYALKTKKQDFVILAGDSQPVDERGSYALAREVIKLAKSLGVKEVITTGGIGRPGEVKKPKIYCVGSDKKVVKRYKKMGAKLRFNVGDSVATIVGATGLLLSEAKEAGIEAASLLVDTFGHPAHLGFEEAKKLLGLFKTLFGIGIDASKLDADIKESNKEMRALKRAQKQVQEEFGSAKDVSYIG